MSKGRAKSSSNSLARIAAGPYRPADLNLRSDRRPAYKTFGPSRLVDVLGLKLASCIGSGNFVRVRCWHAQSTAATSTSETPRRRTPGAAGVQIDRRDADTPVVRGHAARLKHREPDTPLQFHHQVLLPHPAQSLDEQLPCLSFQQLGLALRGHFARNRYQISACVTMKWAALQHGAISRVVFQQPNDLAQDTHLGTGDILATAAMIRPLIERKACE